MSLWAFMGCLDGWDAGHGAKQEADAQPMDVHAVRAAGIEGF